MDVDGTLCPIKQDGQQYGDLPIDAAMRDRLSALKRDGWRILLFSSRGMRTHEGDLAALATHVYPVMVDWLDRNEVPYDELVLGKPWPGSDGFYVDDRAVRPREFVDLSLQQLTELCDRDRRL
ncbi:MAG: capsular biosynthesis protein [Sphingomonas sp.]